MSKFNSYAKRLNTAAKEAFEKYKKAEKIYQAAENAKRNAPWDTTQERRTLLEARLIETRNDLKKAQAEMSSSLETLKAIRGELVEDLGNTYQANPADIDPNTMELLKSGILTPAEYVNLANQAGKNGNNTMLRIIGSYAEKIAQETRNQEERGALFTIAQRAKTSTGAEELGRFDALVDTFKRCTNNPDMIGYWDELTRENIETF